LEAIVTPTAIAVLAFTMSVDAFAVSLARGAACKKPRLREALRTGFIFGTVEALTPVIGWAAGMAASKYVQAWDHWIAFALLGGVGLRMLWLALFAQEEERPAVAQSFLLLVATAIGTSIDAMAVGVSLAILDVDITTIAIAIGLATFLMSSAGMMLGRLIGERFGRMTEVAAGLALCIIGVTILVEHIG
jgi:putative Mn2+ efflux pump MntP